MEEAIIFGILVGDILPAAAMTGAQMLALGAGVLTGGGIVCALVVGVAFFGRKKKSDEERKPEEKKPSEKTKAARAA